MAPLEVTSKWVAKRRDHLQMATCKVPAGCCHIHFKIMTILSRVLSELIRKAHLIVNKQFCLHPKSTSCDLLKLVLTWNNFQFDDKHYLQIGGTAIGTKLAPSFANIFMGWFEDKFIYPHHKLPLLWKQYIDDTSL